MDTSNHILHSPDTMTTVAQTEVTQAGPSLLHHHSSHHDHHDMVSKFGGGNHLFYHDFQYEAQPATRVRDLVRPFVIRQWISAGKIYREASPREVNRFELFFDLLFVAIIHLQADAAIEEPGGSAVLRFILTFWPSWSIWEEARKFANVSGTDDLLHRLWVLAGMICITGYAINASAIELHPAGEEETLDHSAVRAATAFWLVIKLTRVLMLWLYAWRLPEFRTAQFVTGMAVLVPMFVYFPLLFVTSRKAQIVIASIGIVVDITRLDLVYYKIRGHVYHWRLRRAYHRADENERGPPPIKLAVHKMPPLSEKIKVPAMNIEHAIERSSAFVVIVLGELVMNLLFTATRSEIGVSPAYGRAALGLIVAWCINYLYLIPCDPNSSYEHGLRRSFISGILFTFFHWPLCAALTLASAASGHMVRENVIDYSIAWYWGCGLGFALFFATLIDLTHRELLPRTSSRIPRFVRAGITLLASFALIFFPFACKTLTSFALFSVAVGIVVFLVVIHIYGTLPTRAYIRALKEQGDNGESQLHPTSKEAEAENRLRRTGKRVAPVIQDHLGATQGS